MKKKITVKGGMVPPLLCEVDDKLYLLPSWKEVPSDTTLDNLEWIRPKYEQPKVVGTFPSISAPGITYKVIFGNGIYACDCPGHRFRKKECKHIKEILND
jgi:hypothetical protein